MKFIVGLGNPGEKYQKNRHNVGFQFIDYVIENLQNPNSKIQIPNKSKITSLKFQKNKYLDSEIARLVYDRTEVVLAKPMTFMNKSGEAVSKFIRNLKLEIRNLVIVHDDLDIPLGKFKIQKGTGPQLHNGLESIEVDLKTKDFWRVRIGVDARLPDKWTDGETYVLNDFSLEEQKKVAELFPVILKHPLVTELLSTS